MTFVLLEKGLLLEGSTPKIEDKQVPGIYIYVNIHHAFPLEFAKSPRVIR